MRVSYPLSLKVSVWLMLNLLLLAGLGVGFLVVQGGLGWGALVAGPSGDRIQALANVIAGEASAATGDDRTAVLKRFGTAYNAEFYLYSIDEMQIAGSTLELPPDVRTQMEFRPPRMGPGGSGRRGGEGFRGTRSEFDPTRRREGGPDRPPLPSRESPEKGVAPDGVRREPPPMPMGGGGPNQESRTGRFVVRAGTPAAYWVGLRVPYFSAERNFPTPAKLVVRVHSMWALLSLLNLQSWLLAGTGVLVLSVLFWLPLMRSITRSIRQLTTATEQIAEGRFDTRVSESRRDELGKLGESVNRMATRLDAHMTGQKRFLGDVAHELCSPLARLQMATGILADQAPTTLQETVADVREEVQQMSTLVNELLAFTKAGLQAREVVCSAIDLAPLTRDVLAREDTSGRVTLSVADDLRVTAETNLLSRALGNLVRNALRYAGDAGPITVSAQRDHQHVAITVEDNGPGVPVADLDRLGEPFFRPELARTRETGGVGLGLAIVRSSIASCGGDVRFANRTPRGFRAEIRLRAA
ncbi:sensor histidine kinase [Horticoccus sp. 23ND18S-11]|uniref:sensor histidine kinase n=1 Tax=Horticoccus sp. 23ND18S-11 TaxID=3391832 RepID=UPI0039C92B7A